MLPLKTLREQRKGFSTLLPYASMVAPGVMLNKDGSLLSAWFYKGSDIGSATREERLYIAAQANVALSKLGTGWMVQTDSVRLLSSEYTSRQRSFFPDVISRLIDEERRHQFETEGNHYESLHVLLVSYLPPEKSKSKLTDMMVSGSKHREFKLQDKIIRDFELSINEFIDGMNNVFSLERLMPKMEVDEHGREHIQETLLQYIRYAICGEYQPINLPDVPMYMDIFLGGHEYYHGILPKLDDQYIQCLTIDGFPMESEPNILNVLDTLNVSYRWHNRFIAMDQHESSAMLEKHRRKWAQKMRGITSQVVSGKGNSRVDRHAVDMVEQTDNAIAEIQSGLVSYGFYTSTIVLTSSNKALLVDKARYIRQVIMSLGFNCKKETINNTEAWLGTLPGNGDANLRKFPVNSLNFVHLIPTSSVWAGKEINPCPFYPPNSPPLGFASAEGSTPFRMNLHVSDIGHTLVFGPTGSGKSTLLALIAAQFRRYRDASIFCFDKGRSMLPLTLACGGIHYDIGGGGGLQFCPLKNIDDPAEQRWAEDWIETLLELQGMHIDPKQRSEIHRAMNLLRDSGNYRSLTNFIATLQDFPVKEALSYYSIDGSLGYMLDSEEDSFDLVNFQTFEIEDLMNLGEKILIPVLLYLFHKIEMSLKGQPSLIILDEAWIMLGHDVFREKIREWLKVLRKANCAVVLATQSLSDASRSGIMDVLVESCQTKVLLPNYEALSENTRPFYEAIGLNQRQIDIVASATRKKHYYFMSPEGSRLINLELGPVTLAFTGKSSKEDISTILHLRERYQENWPWQWLKEQGAAYEHLIPSL